MPEMEPMAEASDAVSESGGEEGDYESESDGTSTLALRRRAASDDEEDETSRPRQARAGDGEEGHTQDAASSSVDGESPRFRYSDEEDEEEDEPDEGAPPLYEDEEEELLEEEDQQRDVSAKQLLSRRRKGSAEEEEEEDDGMPRSGEGSVDGSKLEDSPGSAEGGFEPKDGAEEEKKESEPFVVPTAGAFYMHDDRFRDSGGARPRRGVGGRKLWEAKDDKPWVHDLFEELKLGDDNFSSEGFQMGARGRGRGRGRGRARGRGGMSRVINEDGGGMRSRALGTRGRGLRSGRPEFAREQVSGNFALKASTEAVPAPALSGPENDRIAQDGHHPDSAVTKKSASSYLSSASPPFIPSGVLQQKLTDGADGSEETDGKYSSNQMKGRDQPGARNPSVKPSNDTGPVSKSSFGSGHGLVSGSQVTGFAWGQGHGILPTASSKTASSSGGQQQKFDAKTQNPQSASRPLVASASQAGKGVAPKSQASSFVRTTQAQGVAQQPQQTQLTASNPRSSIRTPSGALGNNSATGSNNNRYKGNVSGQGPRVGNVPVAGKAPYVFPGAPNAGLHAGDSGFQTAPSVGPVAVQFGGQTPAGIGVPAVGMPMPNYPYGFANPEVTWVPVLAGGGAMGGGYAPPYIPMDGTPSPLYYAPSPTAQPNPGYHLPGRDINGSKHQPPGGLWKPPPSPELGADEFGQRQSKPRRYSEMSFGQ